MASNNDSIKKTLFVIALLSGSIIVSLAAIDFVQCEENAVDKQKNILLVAGLPTTNANVIREQYQQFIVPRLVNLDTGDFNTKLDANTYNQRLAARS